MTDLKMVKLAEALPCGALADDGALCGRDALVALAAPIAVEGEGGIAEVLRERYAGHWMILPICADCAQKMSELYRR